MKRLLMLTPALVLAMSGQAQKLSGTWIIANYETARPGQENVKVSNIGSIIFKKGNSGEKNISYSVLGNNVEDKTPFTYQTHEDYITVSSDGSALNKTWIMVQKSKKYQKWYSTDGANSVQILELRKQP